MPQTVLIGNKFIFKACYMAHTPVTSILNILLAEDDEDDRFFFQRALRDLPVKTTLTTVVNGEHLMDYLAQHSAHRPDVLFLDINMPRKNGIECLREIKNNKARDGMPIIICSTSGVEDISDSLYNSGAYLYLQKCDYSEFKKHILRALTLLQKTPNQQPPIEFFHVNQLQKA